MFTLTCLAVALLIFQTASADQTRFIPIDAPLETVCSNTSRTWSELDQLCAAQYPGYRLLQRGYRERLRDVRAQGLRGLIPLRVKRTNYVVYWDNDFGLDDEEVDAEYLTDMLSVDTIIHENRHSMQDIGPNIQDGVLRMRDNRPRIQDNGPNTQGYGPNMKYVGPRVQNGALGRQDSRPSMQDAGPGPGMKYVEPSVVNLDLGILDKEPTIHANRPSIQDVGLTIQETGPRIEDVRPSIQDVGPSMQNAGPRTDKVGPSIEDVGLTIQDIGPSVEDVRPRIQDGEIGLRDARPSVQNVGPSMKYHDNQKDIELGILVKEPAIRGAAPSIEDVGSSLHDAGPSIEDVRPSMQDVGHSMHSNGSSIQDVALGIRDARPSVRNAGPSMKYVGPGNQNIELGILVKEPTIHGAASSIEDVGPSMHDAGPSIEDVGPSMQDIGHRIQDVEPSTGIEDISSSMHSNGPSIQDAGLTIQDIGTSIEDVKPSIQDGALDIRDARPSVQNAGPSKKYVRPGNQNIELGILVKEPTIHGAATSIEDDVGPSMHDAGPSIEDVGPSMQDVGHRIQDVEPSIEDIGSRMKNNGASLQDVGPSLQDIGPIMQDNGRNIQYARTSYQDNEPSIQDVGSRLQENRLRIQDNGPRTQDGGSRKQDIGPRIQENERTGYQGNQPSIQDVGSSMQGNGPRIQDVWPNMQDYEPNIQVIGTSNQDNNGHIQYFGSSMQDAVQQDGGSNIPYTEPSIQVNKAITQNVDSDMQDVRLSNQDIEPSLQEAKDEEIDSFKHGTFVIPQPRGRVRTSANYKAEDGGALVGALDLENMKWCLVNENYRFNLVSRDRHPKGSCAICEMMPRSDVRPPLSRAPGSPGPLNIYRLTVRCLSPGRRASSRDDNRRVMQALAEVLGLSTSDIEVESSPVKREGDQLQFLILLSSSNVRRLLSKRMIEKKFLVIGVDNLTACRAEISSHPATFWPETDSGNVVVKGSRDKIYVTRECIQTPKGVKWGNPVVWKEVTQSSKTPLWKQTEPNLGDMIHELASNKFENIYRIRDNAQRNKEVYNDSKAYAASKSHYLGGMKHRSLRETVQFLHSLASVPVKSRYLDVVAEELNNILQLDRANISTLGHNPMRLALDLEQIVTNMILESGHDTMAVVKSNVALLVADVHNTDNPLSGVMLTRIGRDGAKMSLNEIHDYNAQDLDYSNGVEVSTLVPQSLISSSRRVAFTIFSDDKLFQGNTSNQFVLHSRIINVAVDGSQHFPLADGEFVEISFKSDNKSLEKKCVFWSFAMKDWSTQGCTLESSNGRDVCRCNHLTHFALLISPPHHHQISCYKDPLQIFTLICCLISLVGLISINVTLLVFNKWHEEFDSLIVLNLSSAMAINIILYVVSTFLDLRHMQMLCVSLGVLLHYSVLACFCWMLVVASLQVYCLISTKGVAGNVYTFCKAFFFAWGAPLVPVLILLFGEPGAYRYQSDRHFCYPHGKAFFETVVGPVAFIMMLNTIAFAIVVCSIYECCCWKNRHKPRYVIEEVAALRRLKTTIFLFFLFGLPWSFGFFAHNHKIFAYLFCLTATLQGFVLCTFIVVIEGQTRVMWKQLLFGR